MLIRIKLMGTLKSKTPPGGQLDLADGASIDDVLRTLDISSQSVQACSVNGQLERNRKRALHPDDELSILPPVGGG